MVLAFVKPEWEGYQGWLFYSFLSEGLLGLTPEVSRPLQLDKKRQAIRLCSPSLVFIFFAFLLNPSFSNEGFDFYMFRLGHDATQRISNLR